MEKTFKLLPPTMPNFIRIERPAGKRQDGFTAGEFSISVAELSKEEAEQYGQLMKDQFLKHWEIKKTQAANASK